MLVCLREQQSSIRAQPAAGSDWGIQPGFPMYTTTINGTAANWPTRQSLQRNTLVLEVGLLTIALDREVTLALHGGWQIVHT